MPPVQLSAVAILQPRLAMTTAQQVKCLQALLYRQGHGGRRLGRYRLRGRPVKPSSSVVVALTLTRSGAEMVIRQFRRSSPGDGPDLRPLAQMMVTSQRGDPLRRDPAPACWRDRETSGEGGLRHCGSLGGNARRYRWRRSRPGWRRSAHASRHRRHRNGLPASGHGHFDAAEHDAVAGDQLVHRRSRCRSGIPGVAARCSAIMCTARSKPAWSDL